VEYPHPSHKSVSNREGYDEKLFIIKLTNIDADARTIVDKLMEDHPDVEDGDIRSAITIYERALEQHAVDSGVILRKLSSAPRIKTAPSDLVPNAESSEKASAPWRSLSTPSPFATESTEREAKLEQPPSPVLQTHANFPQSVPTDPRLAETHAFMIVKVKCND
jgi:hypothetical protein